MNGNSMNQAKKTKYIVSKEENKLFIDAVNSYKETHDEKVYKDLLTKLQHINKAYWTLTKMNKRIKLILEKKETPEDPEKKKKHPPIHFEGAIFSFNNASGNTEYYLCTSKSCKGRLKVVHGEKDTEKLTQSHSEDCTFFKEKQVSDEVPQTVAASTNQLYLKAEEYAISTRRGPKAIQAFLNEEKNKYECLKSIHIAENEGLKIYNSIHITHKFETKLPPEYSKIEGEQFVQTKITDPEKMFIIMFTSQMARAALEMKKFHIDSTYKIVPKEFKIGEDNGQLLNILGYLPRTGKYYPVAHILMTGKEEEDYIRAFQLLMCHNNFRHFSIQTVTVDFELALINAIRTVFLNADIYGCYFHYLRNLKKNVAKTEDTSQLYKILKILPFIPTIYQKFYVEVIAEFGGPNEKNICLYWMNFWGKKNILPLIDLSIRGIGDNNTNNPAETFHSVTSPGPQDTVTFTFMINKLYNADKKLLNEYENGRLKDACSNAVPKKKSIVEVNYLAQKFISKFVTLKDAIIWYRKKTKNNKFTLKDFVNAEIRDDIVNEQKEKPLVQKTLI